MNYKAFIREVPDFPKPGILFYDITTLLKDAEAFRSIADDLAARYQGLIVDDLLATGGTAAATVHLVRQLGGEIAGLDFLVELKSLNGRDRLTGYDVHSMIIYP